MPRPTVRLRMTLLYAGVFLLAGAALLTVSYILVRNNLTADHVSVGSGPADELRRAIQREVADDALAPPARAVRDRAGRDDRALGPAGLARRRARAAPAAADHLDGAARLAGHARRAHRAGGSPRRAQGAGRHLRRHARAPVGRLRQPAALRGQRVARAAHAARPSCAPSSRSRSPTRDASNAELRTMAEEVHDALDRTERLVQSLLTLARSEGAITRRDPLDLASAARLALEHAARDADAAGLAVTADLAPRARWRGDRRLLESLVANLVENAVGHNRPGGRVSVTTSSRDGRSMSRSSTTATCSTPPCCRPCSSPSSASTAAPAATAPASGCRSCARSRRPTAARSRSPCARTAACAPP